MLLELSNDLGNSLRLEETLSILSLRIKTLVTYKTIAIDLLTAKYLPPECVRGNAAQRFATFELTLGTGRYGRVARNCLSSVCLVPAVVWWILSRISQMNH